jgi:PAS domain S-box-containing protein
MLGVVLTFWSFKQMKEAAEARKHTFNIIISAETLLSELKDAETGERGFLLTGDETFLQPYMAAHEKIHSNLVQLRQLTKIPAAYQHLERLSPIVDAKLAELSQAIEMRRKQDTTVALAIVSGGQSKHLMDAIRDEIQSFIKLEQDALAEHEVAFQSSTQILFTLIIGISAAGLLSAIVFAYFFYRQIQQRAMNLAHVQTVHLLENQKEVNSRLQQANLALQESEERFRTLADNISQLAWMADATGSAFWYNQRWFDYTGTTLEEMHGRGWEKVHHPDHQLRVVEKFKHSLETGEAWEDTFPLRGADGQYRWFLSQALPIRNEQGVVLRWFGTNTDITEHKQSEEAFRNIKQKLATTMGLSQLFDWKYDVTSGFFTFSDHYYALHGTTSELEGGNRISAVDFSRKFMHPDDAHMFGEVIARAVETTNPLYRTKTETRILCRNGAVRYVWVVFSITKNAAGQTLKLYGITQDITERKMLEMERDYLDSKIKVSALQDAIFNSANFSSIATDARGVIQIFNVGAEHMLGYTAAEVINKVTPADISDPQEVIVRAQSLSAELDTQIKPGFEALVFKASRGIEDIYELTYIRKDGSRFPAVVSVTALRDAQYAIIGYLLIGTDNTARKQVEAERVRLFNALQENNVELKAAKVVAEKASLAKSVFLSSMSHELRTPLNAILGFAQLLQKGPPQLTDSQLIRLRQVIKAGWYLLELINEILDLAVIESGKLVLSQEAVSLAEVMHECQGMVEAQAQKKGIDIDFILFDNTWHVYADRTRLKQALINLLTNSVKYNREQGTVKVKCTCTPKHIRISIKDSGKGLSPEKLSQLFQPFNRLGQENGSEEGTGIGLVVTKQVIELMGGTISVESMVGVGSEFLIELPRDVAPQLAAENTLAIEIGSQAHENAVIRTLLYVEDNPANLMLVEQIIGESRQIRMLSAVDGESGIALARAHQPDVILMDINLPGISGAEALAILRKDSETAHIPVIALSANAVPRDIEKGLEAGFFRHITKPIKLNEFTEVLDAAMSRAKERTLGPGQEK